MQGQRALNAAAVVGPAMPPLAARGYLLRVWDHWKQVAHAVGVVQTRFLMLVIYAIAVVPTGLLMRLARDPLHLRPPAQGNWTPTPQHERSVDAARRQF
jgi:hypothetical protein